MHLGSGSGSGFSFGFKYENHFQHLSIIRVMGKNRFVF